MPSPYLIQRLTRESITGKVAEHRFGEIFSLDYMGSAEFEFGAFGEFMRNMHKADLQPFKTSVNGVEYFGVFDPKYYATAEEVSAMLQNLADGKYRLKERADFPSEPTRWHRTDAWADIRDNVFWSKENLSSSIVQVFANSVAYMDEAKAKKKLA